MARAHAANACGQSDSIKGLAQSIAKPAYHRLLTAEPALRRAVPTLIIAFLITICLGAFVQVLDQSRQKRRSAERDLAALADYLAERIDRLTAPRQDRPHNIERLQFLLPDHTAVAKFAKVYADQTESDLEQFKKAIASRRVRVALSK